MAARIFLIAASTCAFGAFVSNARVSALAGQAMSDNFIALNLWDQKAWTFTRQGSYLGGPSPALGVAPRSRGDALSPSKGGPDRRGLFRIIHPWAPSQAGDFGMVEGQVTIPKAWKPPYRLRFYCADDYMNDDWRPAPGEWLGGEGFTGHRFKQVLVNDEVVWESDVADAEGPAVQTRFEVDLTPHVEPGAPFRLAFRVIDRVGTDVKLPGDFHYTGNTETAAEKPDDPARFMTHVFWGDALLLRAGAQRRRLAELDRRPSDAIVEKVHASRWPIQPFGAGCKGPAKLRLEMADLIPRGGFPVTCGVPIPPGAAKNLRELSLRDPSGRAVPIQTAVLSSWKDGSLRWVLLDFPAPRQLAGAKPGAWRLDFGPNAKGDVRRDQVVSLRRSGNVVTVNTGAIGLVLGESRDQLVDRIFFIPGGKTVAGPLTGEVVVGQGGSDPSSPSGSPIRQAQGKPGVESRGEVRYAPRWDSIEVTARGPLRATVELKGKLVGRDARGPLGRFVFRLHAYAGQPFVRIFYRIFNDTDATLRIKRFGLSIAAQGEVRSVFAGDSRTLKPGADVIVHQTAGDSFVIRQGDEAIEQGQRSEGWAAAVTDHAAILMAVRHFWQMYPKALRVGASGIAADLFAESEAQAYYEPVSGEAKRHEILVAFLPLNSAKADAAALVRAFMRPPRLFSSEWFCSSGGLGYAAPHSPTRFAALHDYMVKTYGDVGPTVLSGTLGIRNFPDAAYFAKAGAWRNNYYDVMQGIASEYLIGGDPRWFDRLEDHCLHTIDTDTCHIARKDHPEWLGVLYGPSDNHSSSWWSAMLRAEGLSSYYRLSGDPDALEAFLGAADFIVREKAGIGSVSVRDHAGAFITLVRAYDETWAPKYLAAARRLAHDAMTRIDARRGCYSERHGNHNYRGNVPWMGAQLSEPMYLYYRYSGDLDAAKAVVGMAESIMVDNTGDEGPGDFYGYSHNPHYKKTSNYDVLIAPVMGYAWELTGDATFRAAMEDAFERTVEQKTVNWVGNCYWNTPTLLYYLSRG
jgi:hypothetical protein